MSMLPPEALPTPTQVSPAQVVPAQVFPVQVAPVPFPPTQPYGPAPRPNRTPLLAAVGVAVAAAAGVLAFVLTRSDTKPVSGPNGSTPVITVTPTGTPTVSPAGGAGAATTADSTVTSVAAGSLTTAELTSSYRGIYGVEATSDVVQCIGGQVGAGASTIRTMLAGGAVQAQDAYTALAAYAACAPDADVEAGLMVRLPRLLGATPDATCVDGVVSQMSDDQRTTMLVLAIYDGTTLDSQLTPMFQQCA